jgi:PD-(D/E)XK nuclease family transposase
MFESEFAGFPEFSESLNSQNLWDPWIAYLALEGTFGLRTGNSIGFEIVFNRILSAQISRFSLFLISRYRRIMLGNLDNEVIFKKAFTDKIVFKAFVRDILGIDIEVDVIETEKRFDPKVGDIDFKMDIYAESVDKRIVVEIQRRDYDYNFDRFLHYFLMAIAEQQKKAHVYDIPQTVYMIVVLTAPYRFDEKSGKAVRDEVLLMKLNPQTLQGIERDIFGHKLVWLNPNHPDDSTPRPMREWLDLVYQSIHSPERPSLSETNEGVMRAASLIDYDNLTPEERAEMKMNNGRKFVKAQDQHDAMVDVALKLKADGVAVDIIGHATGLTREEIEGL